METTDNPSTGPARSAGIIDDLREPTRGLRRAVQGPWDAFTQLHGAAMADGALTTSTKELIALAISVAKQCDGCIAYHAKAAARAGATHDQLAEVLGVALLMNGGPASVYGPLAWAAFEEFAGPAPG